jgi:cysteine desulfurase
VEVYFDCAASSPLLPSVKEKLTQVFDTFGNPSSLHKMGVQAEQLLNQARTEILRTMGHKSGRLVFTGSGTEANNLAIFGTMRRFTGRGKHAVTTQVEHKCVLEPFRQLEREGFEITYVAPERDGSVTAEKILEAVRDDTVLVSVMHVNNETGAILPVEAIGKALKEKSRAVFHVDGIQAFGKMRDCAKVSGADLYSVSGHKIGAPKGIGALFIRDGLQLEPIVYGGGQEEGLRSGTQNVLGAAAFGEAAKVARNEQHRWHHVAQLATLLMEGLQKIPECIINRPNAASPYIVSATFPGMKGEVLVHALESKGVYVSTGSACSTKSGVSEGSHVLRAMGRTKEEIDGTLRFSMGWWHTEEDVHHVIQVVEEQVSWLRQILV